MSVVAVGSSSCERKATCRPEAAMVRAIASPRPGCRGTITLSSDGKNLASERCASSRISSSPGWVEAATMIGRPRVTAISRSSLAESAGGAGTSSFKFPVVMTLRLPSAVKRSASTCDWARQMSNRPSNAEIVPATLRQREKARDIARRIVRHILMDDVGGKPLGDDRRRGHRARGQQDADIQRAQLLDQGRRGQYFTDAGAVYP